MVEEEKPVSFLVFEQVHTQEKPVLRPTGETFSLAGYNVGLLYKAWKKRGKPLNAGWRVAREELIELQFPDDRPSDDVRLIIDFHPTSAGRIGLIEPVEIFAYTWAGENGGAGWTPLMLKLHDVFYEEYEESLDPARRAEIMNTIPTELVGQESIEFLYLNGDKLGRNSGRNGMTNAAFLHGGPRDYFSQFFGR